MERRRAALRPKVGRLLVENAGRLGAAQVDPRRAKVACSGEGGGQAEKRQADVVCAAEAEERSQPHVGQAEHEVKEQERAGEAVGAAVPRKQHMRVSGHGEQQPHEEEGEGAVEEPADCQAGQEQTGSLDVVEKCRHCSG